MGLDVDIYRIRKCLIKNEKTIYNDIIETNEYSETIYMRKPFLIWYDYLEISGYRYCGIIPKEAVPKVKKKLLYIIKNFKKLIELEQNDFKTKEEYEDTYLWNLRKYIDFYGIISNMSNDEILYIESSQ